MLREGDVLYIKSLDELGKNIQIILEKWDILVKLKKVDIIVLDIPLLDTTKYNDMSGLKDLIADIVLQLLSYMAEYEIKKIKEIQNENKKFKLDKKIKLGRKKIQAPNEFEEVYNSWKLGTITANKAMNLLGLKRNSFYI